MHFLLGLAIIATLIYFAFIRKEDDTAEQAMVKIARVVIFFIIILAIVLVIAINSN